MAMERHMIPIMKKLSNMMEQGDQKSCMVQTIFSNQSGTSVHVPNNIGHGTH